MELDDVVADLMRASGDRLLRLAFQLSHDRAAAEDLVQEALTRVYGSWLRRAPDVTSAEAYLRRAVVNEFLRRRRLRSSSDVIVASVPDVPTDGFADVVGERDRLWRALALLPERQRAVLVLRYYEELPDAEIATLIGARQATVRSLAARGLAALRTGALAPDEEVTR